MSAEQQQYDAYINSVIDNHVLPRMSMQQLTTWYDQISEYQGAFWDDVRTRIGNQILALETIAARNNAFAFTGESNMKLVAGIGGVMMGVKWHVAVYQVLQNDGYVYIEERTIAHETKRFEHATKESAYSSAKAFNDAMKGKEQAQ